MQAWHQKNLLSPDFPFHLAISENLEFPPHWHEEIEVIYSLEGEMQVGLNNEIYTIQPRDIFLIGGGDVHHFISGRKGSRCVIIQFGLAFFDSFSNVISDRRFVRPMLGYSKKLGTEEQTNIHQAMERQILAIMDEYQEKKDGYQMALKARIYDLVVILLRQVPMEPYQPREKSRQISRLKRLEKVFGYVEENYYRNIGLEEIARVANYSPYHFTRFFKESTGINFNDYLNSFRIKKVERLLLDMDLTITEVAYKAGFNSIKTFNRVFKKLKGCSPSEYRNRKL
jgi:AraC-like DNA-binding protein